MLPPPLAPGPPPHLLVPQLRGRGGLQLHPVQVVPRGEVQLVRMGASTPPPPLSILLAAEVCPIRNVQGCARASATSDCNTEHAPACSCVPSHASSGPEVTHRF